MNRARASGDDLEIAHSELIEADERWWQAWDTAAGFQLFEFSAVGLFFDILADFPRATVKRDLLGPEKYTHPFVVGADYDRLRYEAPGHGVDVAVEAHAVSLGDAGRIDIIGVEERAAEWFEQSPLFVLEHERWDLPSDFVHTVVGEVIAPGDGLSIEVEQVHETSTRPEAISNEADRTLDAAFFLRAPNVARCHGEASARVGVLEKPAIEARRELGVREHDGFHVVEDAGSGDAAEESECSVHAAQERAHGLADRELDVQHARVRQCRDERADAAWATRQSVAKVGPVNLQRRSGREVERQKRFRVSLRAQSAKPVANDRDAACVTQWSQPLEYGRRLHLWRLVEQLADLR